MAPKRKVLVIGGGFSGLFAAKDLAKDFDVTLVDAKEYVCPSLVTFIIIHSSSSTLPVCCARS